MDIRVEESKNGKPYNPAEFGDIPSDTKAKEVPPRKPPANAKRPVADQPTFPQMRQSIEEFYVLGGALLAQYPNQKTKIIGTAISNNAGECAESIIEAAKKDPRLRRILVRLTTAGVYSGIFVAHMPIFMAAYIAFQAPNFAEWEPPKETVDAEVNLEDKVSDLA
jgi:hypothetical protein